MATCKQTAVKVVTNSYTLNISEDEADALLTILDCVGGCNSTTRRGLTSGISRELRNAGAKRINTRNKDYKGEIYFVPKL